MNEPFTEQEKTKIAGIVATKTPRRHKVIRALFYILWALLTIQTLFDGLSGPHNKLLSNATALLCFITMYLYSISESEQIIRKFAQGSEIETKQLPYYIERHRKNRKVCLLVVLLALATLGVFITLITLSS